jgi:flagellar hook-length control protein FliK
MEILAALGLTPGPYSEPGPTAPGGGDPFLALLAGMMLPATPPATPPSMAAPSARAGSASVPSSTPVPAATSLVTTLPMAPTKPAPTQTATALGESNMVATAPAIEPAQPTPLPDPLSLDVTPDILPVATKPPPAAPPAPPPVRAARIAAPDPADSAASERNAPPGPALTAAIGAKAISDDGGTVSADAGPAVTMPPASPKSAVTAEADVDEPVPPTAPTTDPAGVGAPAAETAAAPPPAPTPAASDTMPTRSLPPMPLPSPDHRGRAVTARLELVEDGTGSRVRIDLEPADLGRVEVALHLDEAGTAAATFTVDRPETLQLLQRDARTVNEMLSAAGFTVDQGGLDFTLRDPGGGGGGSERRPGTPGRQGQGSGAGHEPGPPPPRYRRRLVDLRV